MNAHTPIAERIAALAPRLGPLVGKLGSPHEGEIVAAARAIGRQLERHGLGWNDLGAAIAAEPVRVVYRDRAPEPDPAAAEWRAMAEFLASREELLSPKEADFIANMRRLIRRGGTPTDRQRKWLHDIYAKITEEI